MTHHLLPSSFFLHYSDAQYDCIWQWNFCVDYTWHPHHRTLQAVDDGIPEGTPVDEAALNDPNSAISQLEKPDIR